MDYPPFVGVIFTMFIIMSTSILVVLWNLEHENQTLCEFITHLQINQTLTSLGWVLATRPQPKEPHISLPNKFDGTHSKFWGFVNQMCLVIWLHFHQHPINPIQVGLIGILLSNMALAWFAPLLEHQSPLFNDFEVFFEKFNATFEHSNKKCMFNIKIRSFCQRSHSTMLYASKFR